MPTRRLNLQGLYNARDLGGYPTIDGGTTAFGVFVRSEAPVDLPEETKNGLKSYGVTASMDFRGTQEIEHRPSDLRAIMPYYHKPLFNEAAAAGGMKNPPPMPKSVSWGDQYVDMVEEARDWAIEVLTLAAENEGAMLYHCTTGKDRTGIMSMYLLAIAGVARNDIAADYCISQVYLEPVYARMRKGAFMPMNGSDPKEGAAPTGAQVPMGGPGPMGGPAPMGGPGPKMDDSFFATKAEYMLQVYDYLNDTYGGVVEYLKLIGVPEAVLDAIRRKFVVD